MFTLVGRFKATDAGRLRAEYNRLVEGLAQRGNLPSMYNMLLWVGIHFNLIITWYDLNKCTICLGIQFHKCGFMVNNVDLYIIHIVHATIPGDASNIPIVFP